MQIGESWTPRDAAHDEDTNLVLALHALRRRHAELQVAVELQPVATRLIKALAPSIDGGVAEAVGTMGALFIATLFKPPLN